MEGGDLLVEFLGEDVDATSLVFVGVSVFPKLNLGESLVGERAGHDERGVTGGATEVEESSLGKDDDTMTIGEFVAVDLVLDVGNLHSWVFVHTVHIDFVIEMSDVSDDGVVLHLGHVFGHDDALVSGGSDVDVGGGEDGFNSLDGVTFHGGLEGADGVTLGDNNSSSTGFHGLGTSLTDITETADDDFFTGNHNIGGSHETIGERVSASVDVVELLLGNAIVDVDGLEEEFTSLSHLLKSEDTGGGLFRDSVESVDHVSPFLGFTGFNGFLDDLEDFLHFSVLG